MDVSDFQNLGEKSKSECESCLWKDVRAKRRRHRFAGGHHRGGRVDGTGQEFSGWDLRSDGRARARRRRRPLVRDRHHLCSGPRLVLRAEEVLVLVEARARLGQERLQRRER